jgi:hypothetical protein
MYAAADMAAKKYPLYELGTQWTSETVQLIQSPFPLVVWGFIYHCFFDTPLTLI